MIWMYGESENFSYKKCHKCGFRPNKKPTTSYCIKCGAKRKEVFATNERN